MTESSEPTPVTPVQPTSKPDADGPVEDAIKDDARASARGKLGWLSVTVAAIFGLFYAYALWTAISHAFEVTAEFTTARLTANDVPWGLVVAGIVLPIVAFLIAFWLGLRRNVFAKLLIFILGLAAVAALTLSLLGFENYLLIHAVLIDTILPASAN